MAESELNGNTTEKLVQTLSNSLEDLSEYTDADESISAPTEILAEFLSAIMMKDYEKALKYCTLILNYEPNNPTAKDFYPLIVEKLELIRNKEYEDSSTDGSDSASLSSSYSSENSEECRKLSDSEGTSASYTSLEDDEASVEINRSSSAKFHLLETDFTNGNANIIQTNISEGSGEENANKKPKEEKTKAKLTPPDPSSPSKILIHPTPTVTLKRDKSLYLERTQTYTKSFLSQNQNLNEVNKSSNLNKHNFKERNAKKSPHKEIPSAGSATVKPHPPKKIQNNGQTKSCRM